ncbi:MAG: methylase, partial [Proteobacteria bacterium]|nr:methylase [Pseudomonadota bacterium]
MDYFSRNGITLDSLASELRDDFSEEHCVSVNDDKDATQKQILLNSLENQNNPYRAIFEVKKLDEGWDVLNLFDIVRLYETRQSGGNRIAPATISEAQLIGRGARYCPFQLNEDQPKFQRKYDEDITNELRVCETLYYHCQNDHRYVNELKEALSEIGLDMDKVVHREYILKEEFKSTNIYKTGKIFCNAREEVSRLDVHELLPTIRDNFYQFRSRSGTTGLDFMMSEIDSINDANVETFSHHLSIKQLAEINYAIVNKALMKYPIFKFNTLKSYFPNLSTTREFITDNNYLGGVTIDIHCPEEEPSTKTMHDAALYVLGKIAQSLSQIEKTYRGTQEFRERNIRDTFKDKTVNYTDPHGDGAGVSQNSPNINPVLKIDLSSEDWFVYKDNYGTSEEKAFVAFFRGIIDRIKQKYSRVYLIRNEREFCIYSLENGERFEPDYVLFLQNDKTDGIEQMQIFIEPKGTHLLDKDSWKEKLLLQLKNVANAKTYYHTDDIYRILGFHFFNQDQRMNEFRSDIKDLLD